MREINIVGMEPSALSLKDQKMDGEVWGINYAYLYTNLDRLFIAHEFGQFMADSVKEGRRGDNWLSAVLEDRVKEIYSYLPLDIAIECEDYPPQPNQELNVTYSHEPGGLNEDEMEGKHHLITAKQIQTTEIIKTAQIDQLTCTLPYVIGQAIVEKVDRIILWGVGIWDYGGNNQYGGQIPAVDLMMRTANARGIQTLVTYASAQKMKDKIFVKGDRYRG